MKTESTLKHGAHGAFRFRARLVLICRAVGIEREPEYLLLTRSPMGVVSKGKHWERLMYLEIRIPFRYPLRYRFGTTNKVRFEQKKRPSRASLKRNAG